MAELSHQVAVLAEGVAMMETTLVGVIQVDPRRLLEDGVRRELVQLVAKILHEGLTFSTRVKVRPYMLGTHQGTLQTYC